MIETFWRRFLSMSPRGIARRSPWAVLSTTRSAVSSVINPESTCPSVSLNV